VDAKLDVARIRCLGKPVVGIVAGATNFFGTASDFAFAIGCNGLKPGWTAKLCNVATIVAWLAERPKLCIAWPVSGWQGPIVDSREPAAELANGQMLKPSGPACADTVCDEGAAVSLA
jgi:hypothetical protein